MGARHPPVGDGPLHGVDHAGRIAEGVQRDVRNADDLDDLRVGPLSWHVRGNLVGQVCHCTVAPGAAFRTSFRRPGAWRRSRWLCRSQARLLRLGLGT